MHTIIVGGLLLAAMICSGAEQETEVTFKRLEEKFPSPDPNILSDIVKKIAMERAKLIANTPVQAAHSSHPIEQDLQEQHQLLLPSTFPIHPVCYNEQTASYLPQVHCWVPKNNNGSLGVYVDNDEKKSSDFYNFGTIGGDILFDANKVGKVLFCLNEGSRFRFRLTQQLEKRERLYGMEWDLIDGGAISALALHPKENKAAFISRKAGYYSAFSVFNFDKREFEALGVTLRDKYKGVAYCGNDTWVVLTEGGQVAIYQQVENGLTDISLQFFSKLNARMIGVNVKHSTKDGFKPLWALLDPGNRLWICAFSHKFRCLCKERNKSALLAIATILDIDCTNISYENDKISVLYRYNGEPNLIIKSDVYTVDFEAIYLYKLAKQLMGLEQDKNNTALS